MKILLGSKNSSKTKSLEIALKTLGINEYEIVSYNALSNTSSKPIGYEIIRGLENRNIALKDYATQNNIEYDYLCSIEGGFSLDENGLPFVITYCIMEDKTGKKSTGKSLGIRLTKVMYEYVKAGGSLNKIIEEIIHTENNKQSLGITGYLTAGLYNREKIDSEAVISALIPFVYMKERDCLDQHIKELKNK